MNAADFLPENEWAQLDSRIQDVDPRQPPISPWTGEQLRKHFRSLKTKFALVTFETYLIVTMFIF